MYIITWITNPNILILIPPSEVQETTSFKSNVFNTMLIINMIMYIHHNVHHIIQTQLFKGAVKSAM
jgi:uncharacterized membrane protein